MFVNCALRSTFESLTHQKTENPRLRFTVPTLVPSEARPRAPRPLVSAGTRVGTDQMRTNPAQALTRPPALDSEDSTGSILPVRTSKTGAAEPVISKSRHTSSTNIGVDRLTCAQTHHQGVVRSTFTVRGNPPRLKHRGDRLAGEHLAAGIAPASNPNATPAIYDAVSFRAFGVS